jgi:hypothetical protein
MRFMLRTFTIATIVATLVLTLAWSGEAAAEDLYAGPDDYRSVLSSLAPGDTLHLEAGTYTDLLPVSGLHGAADAWITITGPQTGEPAVFLADPGPCCNTVEITDSSYLAIENLTIDGNGVGGAFGVSAKNGTSNLVHHVRIEGCTFVGHDAHQYTVAISTKTPTWGWVIRGNVIDGAGTGMYLGNSDGTSPFIAGVIEHNMVTDTIGYNVQVKWQQPRPDVAGMPTGPSSTVIRHNVFIKTDRPSDVGDRPNLLVGGFPDSGPGSEDRYEIYGNLFYHNPRESLIQCSGRVTIHDNVFVDVAGRAIALQDHDLPLRQAFVYHNTIYSASRGVSVSGSLDQGCHVVGNLVFADTPVSASGCESSDNMTGDVVAAASYVVDPSTELGAMDFYPLAGQCQGPPVDVTAFAADMDHDLDFNGTQRTGFTFRGAYAGEGTNPGWPLSESIKTETPATPPDDPTPETPPETGPDAPPDVPPDAFTDAPDDASGDPASPAASSSSACGCTLVG